MKRLTIGGYRIHCEALPTTWKNQEERIRYLLSSNEQNKERGVINFLRQIGHYEQIDKLQSKPEWRRFIHEFDIPYLYGSSQTYKSHKQMLGYHDRNLSVNAMCHHFIVHFETHGCSLEDFENISDIIRTICDIELKEYFGYVSLSYTSFVMIFASEFLSNLVFDKSHHLHKWAKSRFPSYLPNDFVKKGLEVGKKGFEYLKQCIGPDFDGSDDLESPTLYHEQFWIRAKIAQYIEKNDVNAKIYYLCCTVSTVDMYLRIISLIALSKLCSSKRNNEYQIALKILKIAYKLSLRAKIMPKFVGVQYKIRRNKLKKKWHKTKCINCRIGYNRRTATKLRCCTGCMKISYCSRKCQKNHWKCDHRAMCDRSWVDVYHCLKSDAFK